MFDTHCHLQFGAFKKTLVQVVDEAKKAGVAGIVVPGTDVESSRKAVGVTTKFDNIYAAVGIHPHHVFYHQIEIANSKDQNNKAKLKEELNKIEGLLQNNKIVAVGEVGVDRYYYQKTKYTNYEVSEQFIQLQKDVLGQQIELALKYKKSLILHNRQAVDDLLSVLGEFDQLSQFQDKAVFHCCEPEEKLLNFAKNYKIFIGVDGDVTYDQAKQEFIKKVPPELLVLETDSPFLIPEPLRSQSTSLRIPNEPKYLSIIAEFIAKLKGISQEELVEQTTKNAKQLFSLR